MNLAKNSKTHRIPVILIFTDTISYCIFWTIKCTPPQICGGERGASYSTNVAYLAHWGGESGSGTGFFFLFSSSKT